MLSPGITLMLDRVRSEFGLQTDVLDVNLASALGADRQNELGVRRRPELTAAATAAVRQGHASDVAVEGRAFRLLPLHRNRVRAGLLIVSDALAPGEVSSERLSSGVVELLRTAIEADWASGDDAQGDRQQNRTLMGILRFLRYVLLARNEAEVADAVTHATAVWFDVDPRVYRRDASGDYVLFSHLPSAEIAPGAERLEGVSFGPDLAVVRLSPDAHRQAVGSAHDGLLVPAPGAHAVDWVLALLGNVPVEAELILGVVARVLGAQMERLAMRRDGVLRRHFEGIVIQRDRPAELRAVEAVRQLLSMTNGAGAAVWIRTDTGIRRLAAAGSGIQAPGEKLHSEHVSCAERYVRTIGSGDTVAARLELTSSADAPFTPAVERVVDACAGVLDVWLAGTSVQEAEAGAGGDGLSGFVRRIQEELARARRFDRRLALLVIQASAAGEGADLQELVPLLRRELRESDLLGTLGHDRIVAVLIETDAHAVGAVVRRVRTRLGEAASTKGLPGIAVGEAAFSEECTTVDALLTRAQFNAQVFSSRV